MTEHTSRRRVALAAGGTAGHIHLALATADEFARRRDEYEVLIIGATDGLEERLVPESGFPFATLRGSPYHGEGVPGKLRSARNLGVGMLQGRRLLARAGIDLVVGFGSYASLGALLAARSLGIRTVIHEANWTLGLANRVAARFVDRVYLGHEDVSGPYPREHACVTGNPVRSEIAHLAEKEQEPPRRRSGCFRFVVMGGSLGSPFLNRRAPDLLARIAALGSAVEVVHVVGYADPAPLRRAYRRAGITAFVTHYVADIARAYRHADFAIATPGAVTLAELAFAGLPALLVPLGQAAEDHQHANAAAFARAGGGTWVAEEDWQPTELAVRIVALLRDEAAYRMAARCTRELAVPGAARALVDDCTRLLEQPGGASARGRTALSVEDAVARPRTRAGADTRLGGRILRAGGLRTVGAALRSSTAVGIALLVVGVICLGQALVADFLGLGAHSGYGRVQQLGLLLGPSLAVAGIAVLRRGPPNR